MPKQCPRCGITNMDGVEQCSLCRTPLNSPAVEALAASSEGAGVGAQYSQLGVPPGPQGQGIGGWLILVAIGLVVSPWYIMYGLLTVNLPYLLGPQHQDFLSAHPASAALVGFEALTNVVYIASLLALNYLFFTRKKAFPTFIILYYGLHFFLHLGIHVCVRLLHPDANQAKSAIQIVQNLVGAAIWIPYFLASERVKATFVR